MTREVESSAVEMMHEELGRIEFWAVRVRRRSEAWHWKEASSAPTASASVVVRHCLASLAVSINVLYPVSTQCTHHALVVQTDRWWNFLDWEIGAFGWRDWVAGVRRLTPGSLGSERQNPKHDDCRQTCQTSGYNSGAPAPIGPVDYHTMCSAGWLTGSPKD